MNSRQEARNKSNRVTLEFFDNNLATAQKIPNYAPIRAEIEKNMLETQTITKAKMELSKSDTKELLQQKHSTLVEDCVVLTHKINALGKYTKNTQLIDIAQTQPSSTKRLSPPNLIALAQILLENATKHLTELGTYGIVQADIDSFTLSLKNYQEYLPKPQAERNESKILTDKLDQTDKKTEENMKNLDTQVLTIEKTYPDFVKEYFAARTPTYYTNDVSVLGTITNKTTSEPIYKALLYFVPVNNKRENGSTIATTQWLSAKKGGFRIQHLVTGEYDMTVKMMGYETFTTKVLITNIETVKLDIQLTPTQ